MIIATGLRLRVERLLRGDFDKGDLHELFFNMREELRGSGVVSEIGHFIAHPGVRTQRMTYQEVRDFFAFVKFRFPVSTNKILHLNVPCTMPDALRANMRRIRPSVLKRETRTNPVRASKVLERILSRLTPLPGGGLSKAIIRNPEEQAVFVCVASHVKSGPIFTQDDLMKDFEKVLSRMKLLRAQELPALRKRSAAVSILALLSQHCRKTDLGDGTTATLQISPDQHDNLAVYAIADVAGVVRWGETKKVALCVFQTELPVTKYCEKDVAPAERYSFEGDFELTRHETLGRLS